MGLSAIEKLYVGASICVYTQHTYICIHSGIAEVASFVRKSSVLRFSDVICWEEGRAEKSPKRQR